MNGWSEEMDAVLRRVIEAGGSYSSAAGEINQAFGTALTRNATIGRGHRMGLQPGFRVGRPRTKVARPKAPRRTSKTPEFNAPRPVRSNPIVIPKIEADQPALRCVEVTTRDIGIHELSKGDCRYPLGDGPFVFCGNPSKGGSSYCGAHHSLCHGYTPPPRRPDAKRPGRKISMFGSYYFNVEAA